MLHKLTLFCAFFIPASIALTTDLWSKLTVFKYFEKQNSIQIIENFFYFSRAHNTGVAFGMMQEQNDYLIYIIPILMIGILVYVYLHRKEPILHTICLGFIFGGALGNYHDRFFIGYVRDFIEVIIFGYSYPIFNVADAFISCSVALLLILSFFSQKKSNLEN